MWRPRLLFLHILSEEFSRNLKLVFLVVVVGHEVGRKSVK